MHSKVDGLPCSHRSAKRALTEARCFTTGLHRCTLKNLSVLGLRFVFSIYPSVGGKKRKLPGALGGGGHNIFRS